MRRLVVLLGLALIVSGIAFATGQGESQEAKTIEIFSFFVAAEGDEGEPAAIQMAADMAAEKNPGVTYTPTGVPQSSFKDKLTLEIASNNEPDIVMIDAPSDLVAYHALRPDGVFLDLESLMEGTIVEDLIALQMGRVQGTQVAIPAVTTAWTAFYYRKSLFENAGIDPDSIDTWERLAEVSAELTTDTDGDGHADQFGFAIPTRTVMNRWATQQFFWQVGGGWFEDDTLGPYTAETVNLDSSQNLYALTYLRDTLAAGGPPGLRDNSGTREMFFSGRVAIMGQGSYEEGVIADRPAEVREDIGVFRFPSVEYDGDLRMPVSPNWGLSWAISGLAEWPEEAFDFIEAWSGTEIQEYISAYQSPVNPEVYDEYAKTSPLAARQLEWAAEFRPIGFPSNPRYNELDKVMQRVLEDTFSGVKTPQEALRWGQREMVAIMSE